MAKSIEEIVLTGDLTELTPEQRVQHYKQVCESLGLDPRLKPLEYLHVDTASHGRNLILYLLRSGTDQLRKIHGIKITKLTKEMSDDMVIYTAEAVDKNGQTDISAGAVSLKGRAGQDRANAIMAAETKSKRRVTISLSGAGLLDETEVADMSTAVTVASPGIGVSAAPPQVYAPVASSTAGTEVVSTPAPTGRDPRIDFYTKEVLPAGQIKSEPGRTIGAKWVKFVLTLAGVTSTKEMNPVLWKPVLDKLDLVRGVSGDRGVVAFIEETIAGAKA